MSLKTLSHSKCSLFFLLIILFFICSNFRAQWPYFKEDIQRIKDRRIVRIGPEFKFLAPYLRNVDGAGWATCLKSSHPSTDVAIMGPYQQAQFVLSPTILNYIHPFDYRYVVFQCPPEARQKYVEKYWSRYIVLKNDGGVSLLYRKRGSP
ncbi:MAG: hypothetical protein KGJ09_02240 [Candidatus Omnitrophica bacterium]|nr:hypothetical protein [Candidatus Omnitrophota bacterium]MDE2008878.1 hypothetical protein [Candidatus Omnitrophota bacterium]MDE2213559.1 hypothetical protein [Candidatus Omnitrophota bacterium]MDE2230540.1 hypothetical protein [Candidatus Omnitrophota bacterium]